MQSFITINGTKFPQPRRGLELLSATIVDSARNANGGRSEGRQRSTEAQQPLLGLLDSGAVVYHVADF